ncbi:Mediator of RNA polymerase II transcription subunit 31 [Emydomyces testavorans]|uniref:Mediator of RNA polymerase II transcription subunit 31 n=1 Tax=Emydomyces testavorans TaxID=2070801 RepID=A0AAF0DBM6_9EURO|nr:Mediator of RNA polymerase II transcription subunit 31 [Emydomyces testavorans]
MAQEAGLIPPPPHLSNPRFTLELEFVLSLANPYYISHLAVTYPHLLGISSQSTTRSDGEDSSAPSDDDAQAFAAYLAYLYDYWKRPEYVQFLTHPRATLRALRLLQEESFRKAVIRPQVIEALLGTAAEVDLRAELEAEEGKGKGKDDAQRGAGGTNGTMT